MQHDSFETMSGRQIDLRMYVEPNDLDRVNYALESLKRAMRWDEQTYGREYDLEIFMIVAVSHFNMGAMENKGLNIFNSSCVLANPEAATDQAFQRIEAIVAHEYFHNWSGNRVTCRDWFQLSLKEGFTVFRDSEFSADINSRAVKRIQDVNFLRSAQFTEDAGPTAHPVQPSEYQEISNFYTLTIYEKGAEIVRMIRTLLGPELFRKGSDLYFERHDGCAVTIGDFVQAMSDVSGRDFDQFMRWYKQLGTPIVHVQSDCNIELGLMKLSFQQSPPINGNEASHMPYLIPISYQVIDQINGEILVPESLFELTDNQASIELKISGSAPVVSVFRGLSAPVKVEMDRSTNDLVSLAIFDNDGVTRWDAIQALYIEAIRDLLLVSTSKVDGALVDLIVDLASDPSKIADPACLAEMLTLPQDNILWDILQPADPQRILEARKALRIQIATRLEEVWMPLYQAMQCIGSYQPDARAIGCRSLGFVALSYLVKANSADSLLRELFTNANNLTERFAAYRIALSDGSDCLGKALSDEFLEKANTDEVLDLWLSNEAVNEKTATLDRVRELTTHQRFSWTNPNRVRSVLGAFSNRNVKAFHTAEGYQFLAEAVLKLDAMNPQIASRLVMPLCQWSRFTITYQEMMCRELRQISTKNISKDLHERVYHSIGKS